MCIFGRTLPSTRDEAGNIPAPLVIRKGSMVYLKAPSGVGKTTLAKVMMGLLSAEQCRCNSGTTNYNERHTQKTLVRAHMGASNDDGVPARR